MTVETLKPTNDRHLVKDRDVIQNGSPSSRHRDVSCVGIGLMVDVLMYAGRCVQHVCNMPMWPNAGFATCFAPGVALVHHVVCSERTGVVVQQAGFDMFPPLGQVSLTEASAAAWDEQIDKKRGLGFEKSGSLA